MQVKIKQIEGLQGIIDTPVVMGLEYSQSTNILTSSNGNEFQTTVSMDFTPFADSVIQVQVNGLTVEGSYTDKLGGFYFSNDGIIVKSMSDLESGDFLYWNGVIKGYQLEVGDIVTILYEKEYLSYGTSGISGNGSGTDGSSGTSGIDGTNGTSGIDGTNGTSGIDGTNGTSGIDGTNGSAGTSGIDGTNGSAGTSGVSGTNGSAGTSGLQGPAGETLSVSGVVEDYNTLMNTYGSITGEFQPVMLTTVILKNTSELYIYDSVSGSADLNGWVNMGEIQGPQGVSGDNGTSGTSGIGVNGTNGSAGTSGIGANGTSGVNGTNGSAGTSGIGVNGTSGVNGTAGTSGIDGAPRRNVTKIATKGWGGSLLVADNKVFTFNGTEWNVNYIRGAFASSGNDMCGLSGMREVTFPGESGKMVDAGAQSIQAYALFDNGNLWMWGYNGQGQLGVGNTTTQFFPVLSATNVSKIYTHPSQDSRSEAYSHFFILKTDGKVYGTGYNNFGQLGLGNTTDKSSWTEITAIGTNPRNVWPLGAYTGVTVVEKSDGSIWICGYNSFGQLGLGNTTQTISTLTNTGTGWNNGDTSMIIKEIGFGGGYGDSSTYEGIAITMFMDNGSTSRIASSGNNNWGNLGDGSVTGRTTPVTPTGFSGRVSKMVKVGGVAGSIWILKTDNTLWNFGYGGHGQLDRGNTTQNNPTPQQVETSVLDILVHNHSFFGYNYQVASPIVKKSNGYYRCGYNGHGQLGDGTTTNRSNLVKMRFPEGIVLKSVGTFNKSNEMVTWFAVDIENKIWSWGDNAGYQIHNTTTTSVLAPIQITPNVLIR